MANNTTPKKSVTSVTKRGERKLAEKKAEEAMQSFLGQEIRKLKLENLQLEAKLQKSKEETNNLELAYQKSIDEKKYLGDTVHQLQDDVNKYKDWYSTAKRVAQSLGEAVYFLTKEKKHG